MFVTPSQHSAMSMPIRIRELDPQLRKKVAALRLAPHQHPYVPPMRQVLARARRKASAREFAILREDVVVGYFQLNLSASETAHYCDGPGSCGLEAMMVDLRMQGQGIGFAALVQLPQLVEANLPEHDRVCLTVNLSNRPAQKLYLRCGFADTGVIYHGAPSGPQHVYALLLPPARDRRDRATVRQQREATR